MKLKKSILLVLICIVQFSNAQDVKEKFIKIKQLQEIEEYLYQPNGLKILLLQDNSAPVVNVQIVYGVGSRHEVSGNTGSTHLLEHLMFKGTHKFNKRKGTSISGKLNNIGAQMNATTWKDRTNYYETIPSDKIELALEIEADRMRNSLLLEEDKKAEMTVVRNEFEREENNPNSVLNKEIWASAYMAHPYHHSTIGWRSDIEKIPISELRKFYDTYYWPNNATLTIIGDFKKEKLFNLVDKYFVKITRSPHEMPQPYTEEPPQYGPRTVVIEKPGKQSVVSIGYKIPGRMHEDLPALTVLGQIFGSGTNSVLNKEFVDKEKAYTVFARPSNFKEVGLFSIGLSFSPKLKNKEIHKDLVAIIEKVKREGVKQEDVDRIVAKLNAQTLLSRDGYGSIAGQLNEAIAAGDWTDYILASERLSKVTADDVKRVANKYLVENQSTTGYFIPKQSGSNRNIANKPVRLSEENDGKFYYRHPEYNSESKNQNIDTNSTVITKVTNPIGRDYQASPIKREFTRKNLYGIDVITTRTGAKGFVTIAASIPISKYYDGDNANELIPTLTARMLSKGTTLNDKFAFSEKLEKLGANIRIWASGPKINIQFKCLKKDLETIVSLLSEELRFPLFDEKEFSVVKNQLRGNLKRKITSTASMGNIALTQAIYPKGHPNYIPDIDTSLEDIENATLNGVKAFHQKYFGPAGMHLVAVGDIDTKELHNAIKKSFRGWKGGVDDKEKFENPTKVAAMTKVVTIPQKPSADLFIGQYTGLKKSDKDFLPFYIGNFALGAGFSGRLMRTVRDEKGLTYSIRSRHSGDILSGGHWTIKASFNPNLFQKGLDETMKQLKKWSEKGISPDELIAKKNNLTGSFKVGMATTSGIATAILGFVERDLDPSYIDQYPKDIEDVTLNQVNNAIKKYIDLENLIIIKAGSLSQNGMPLTE